MGIFDEFFGPIRETGGPELMMMGALYGARHAACNSSS
jgi:hypothetical protein